MGEDTTSALDHQPVALAEAVKGLTQSALALAVLFGLRLSADQLAGIMLVLVNLLGLITLLVVPQRVSTKRTVETEKAAAYIQGAADANGGQQS